MPWIIRSTDTFIESFRKFKDNSKIVAELARKIKRLQADPLHVGGWLCQERSTVKNQPVLQKSTGLFFFQMNGNMSFNSS